MQIILLNFRQELSILAEAGGKKSGVDDCSDVMVKEGDPSLAFLGHNEDNTHDTVNTSYFVQATIVSPSADFSCCLLHHFPFCLVQEQAMQITCKIPTALAIQCLQGVSGRTFTKQNNAFPLASKKSTRESCQWICI